jgi:peptidyl-prolyl cis-trans isomerase A (cyclophilin A)
MAKRRRHHRYRHDKQRIMKREEQASVSKQIRGRGRRRARRSSRLSSEKREDIIMFSILAVIISGIIAGYFVYQEFFMGTGAEEGMGERGGEEKFSAESDTGLRTGVIEIKLYVDKAPITTKNFIDLANQKKYDGCPFHRIIENFMIQGGDFENGDGTGGHAAEYHEGYGDPDDPSTWVIPDEFHPDLKNIRCTVAMANRGPNTGGSQFFINVVDNPHLDNKHAVFGKVIKGMDIVDEISKVDTDDDARPIHPVIMKKVRIIGSDKAVIEVTYKPPVVSDK